MINLEYERRQKGLSQRKLAECTRVGQNYISFAESRGFVPAEGTQKKLADFLGWNDAPAKLFEEKED